MTHHAKPYFVVAMVELPPGPDGRKRGEQVLIGQFDHISERDDFFKDRRAIWLKGGMAPEVRDICRGEVHGARGGGAEEADIGLALLALALGGPGHADPDRDSQSFAQMRMETVT